MVFSSLLSKCPSLVDSARKFTVRIGPLLPVDCLCTSACAMNRIAIHEARISPGKLTTARNHEGKIGRFMAVRAFQGGSSSEPRSRLGTLTQDGSW